MDGSIGKKANRLLYEKSPYLLGLVDFASQYKVISGNATIYICETYACQQPTTDSQQAIKKLL